MLRNAISSTTNDSSSTMPITIGRYWSTMSK